MDMLFRLVVVALVLAAVWYALQPRCLFVVCIEEGTARLDRGKVAAHFVQEIGQVCREAGVQEGQVWGVPQGRRISLRFSRSIPSGCRQRLRNLWNLPA
jgi:Protein of unknown function (DUF3634)